MTKRDDCSIYNADILPLQCDLRLLFLFLTGQEGGSRVCTNVDGEILLMFLLNTKDSLLNLLDVKWLPFDTYYTMF